MSADTHPADPARIHGIRAEHDLGSIQVRTAFDRDDEPMAEPGAAGYLVGAAILGGRWAAIPVAIILVAGLVLTRFAAAVAGLLP